MTDPHQTVRNIDQLLAKVGQIEELLPFPPGMPGRTDQIVRLASSIEYTAPNHQTADLANKVHREARDRDSRRFSDYVSRLKAELNALKQTYAVHSSDPRQT